MLKRFIFIALVFLVAVCNIQLVASAEAALIEDPNLEQAIRIELGKPDGIIDKADLLSLKTLYPKDKAHPIKSLNGLQYATNLQQLYLPDNQISDISPLASLTKLSFLALNNNKITSISSLVYLVGLNTLVLSNNQISDISWIANLRKLTDLLIDHNQIIDLQPLKYLTFKWLVADHNRIRNISSLQINQSLSHLYLSNNRITDGSTLTSLTGLSDLNLENNPLNENTKSIMRVMKAARVKVAYTVNAIPPIPVIFNQETMNLDIDPIIEGGKALVQFRPVFEKIGLEITWDGATKTITGVRKDLTIVLQIGSKIAYVNGEKKELDVAPRIEQDYTLIPLRFVGEAANCQVSWDNKAREIHIKSSVNVFVKTNLGLSIQADEKWSADMPEDFPGLFLNNVDHPKVSVFAYLINSGISLEKYMESLSEVLLNKEQIQFKGRNAYQYNTFNAKANQYFLILLIEAKQGIYRIGFTAPKEDFESYKAELSKILDTFEVIAAQ